MYRIVGYRKKVVFKNLRNSFPDKTEKEIKTIAKKFYKHFTDITLEGLKGFTMNKKNLSKRFILKDTELNKKHYQEGKNVIFAAAHYGNWEWGPPDNVMHKVGILFKPLKDKKINTYLKKKRSSETAELFSIRSTPRAFFNHDRPFSVTMIADQHPPSRKKAIWVDFLNQPTACLHGIEFYAKRYNTTVVFSEFRRVKRGYYEVYLETITENPKEMEHGQITKIFMQKLEKIIIAKPENWLWSHKRWKYKFDPEKDVIIS